MDYQKLKELIPKKTLEWTSDNVASWLNFIHLPAYIENFRKVPIDGSCLLLITEDDLRVELKVTSNIVVKKLLNWINIGLPDFNDSFSDTQSSTESFISRQMLMSDDEVMVTQMNKHQITEKAEHLRKSVKKDKLAVLIIKKMESMDKLCYRFDGKNVQIGRHFNCDIILQDDNVDAFHCDITRINSDYYLSNKSHHSNTYVKLQGRIKMKNHMLVEMGINLYSFTVKRNELTVQVVSGHHKGERFTFDENTPRIIIGRKTACDLSFISDSTLSNFHAKVQFCNGNWTFEDIETTNGSWLELKEEIKVTNGMIFKLGPTNNNIYHCQFQKANKRQQKQTNLCGICKNKEKDALLVPCNHCTICFECSESIESCPLCSEKVHNKIKIFRV